MTTQKAIIMKFKIGGGINGVIPQGIVQDLVITVKDEVASFHFTDGKITRAFYEEEKKKGAECRYFERIQQCIVKYPNKTQKEIVEDISKQIKSLEKKNE